MLLSPSVIMLHTTLRLCESELLDLNMSLNAKKIGNYAFWTPLQCLTTLGGDRHAWVGICSYLDVYFSSAGNFQCCFGRCKASFCRSLNAIFGHLGRCASPQVTVHLLSSKCMPVLLYGRDSCPTNATDLRSLELPVTRAFTNIVNTKSIDIVSYYESASGFKSVREQMLRRKEIF